MPTDSQHTNPERRPVSDDAGIAAGHGAAFLQRRPGEEEALGLADVTDTAGLAALARQLRDERHRNIITYSRKVFIPLTHLCRDVCHYCTFARTPRHIEQAYMSREQVFALCEHAASVGCQEALFTLGEKPELRYKAAREALAELGYASTLEYVAALAGEVHERFGLLPHINAGNMSADEIAMLRPVSASMGIMLESASERLCGKGMPHYGSPDKVPAVRLDTMRLAGEAAVPFTTGILIGIGETRRERIEALLAIRALAERYGHIQEVIIQNFRAKPDTKMAQAPEPDLEDLLWTIAVARLIFGGAMNIQAPPNLSPGVLPRLVEAGINDWGGVSPVSPDHVNPEAPWPHLDHLAQETAAAGKFLEQRLTIYPDYVNNVAPVNGASNIKNNDFKDGNNNINNPHRWLDSAMQTGVMALADGSGFAKRDDWYAGEDIPPPPLTPILDGSPQDIDTVAESSPTSAVVAPALNDSPQVADAVQNIITKCRESAELTEAEVTRLFEVRGEEFLYVIREADKLRREVNGDGVSYVVNRNINYTNVCYFKCQFCAFSKGKHSESLRGKPYDISAEEIARRCSEAWQRGATEVCMQGGIHPDYTGQTYLDILHTVRQAVPEMHIHAFSPLEVWQGAATLGVSLSEFLSALKQAGLNTLPGTAAEILHDEVRQKICPDKLNTAEWLEVMETAHGIGFKTTATIMFGHVDQPRHWAAHLLGIRALQRRTGGFTEFVPLPYVHKEAPMYLKGNSRRGPSYREAILMHAVPRLVFHGLISNIQASWVKLGQQGLTDCLNAGVNDVGGTLMNESITRAAGAEHGQEWSPPAMERLLQNLGRPPRMRTTLYATASEERYGKAMQAGELLHIINNKAGKKQVDKILAVAAQ
ncbi:MAG: bifunctional FO biosynthesis protein CofGH [Pseudohongiellaceae bacterium]